MFSKINFNQAVCAILAVTCLISLVWFSKQMPDDVKGAVLTTFVSLLHMFQQASNKIDTVDTQNNLIDALKDSSPVKS